MASLGDLVVRIGADTRDLNRQLGRVQRNMRNMTGNMQRLGESLTRSVTLPLAAIGAAAIKSAADLETLETSFVSLTGGVDQARAMMQQLNEFTAKTPFQIDAVAKSARQLIASGTRIDEVNDQLQFLGDIAATSGSSIDEIAAIFAKVRAKGKVELENLNQLAERGIPIFQALSEATGLPADKLGAGAVSVQEFTEALKGFAAQGGFAEGAMLRLSQTTTGKFSTAMDNAKMAAADLGKEMLPIVSDLLDRVTSAAQSFLKLDDNVKRAVLAVAGLAAAFGPIIAFLPQLITQFTALSVVVASNPILAFAAVITTIGVALKAMKVDAEKATKSIAELRDSFNELTDESREQKQQDARDTINMLLGYKDLQQQIKDVQNQASEGFAPGSMGAINSQIAATKEFMATLDDSQVALLEQGDALLKVNRRGVFYTTRVNEATDAIIEQQKTIAALTPVVVTADDATTDLTNTVNESGAAFSGSVPHLNEAMHAITDFTEASRDATVSFGYLADGAMHTITDWSDTTTTAIHAAQDSWTQYVQMFGRGVDEVITGSMNMRQAVISVIKDIILARLAESKANVVSGASAFAASTGPAAPFVIGATLAGMMAVINSIQIPKLAKGGLAFGPTLSLVGDNRNAKVDPEVIAPLSKLKDMMGGNRVEVYGRISGNDIFLSNSRTMTARERYT